MAMHTDLKIYKPAYDLLNAIVALSKNLPRDFKHQIGGQMRDESLAILTLIFRANVSRDKAPHLLDLIERVQMIELLLRLSKDMRFISVGQYAGAIELTNNIGKQANGWRKFLASPAS